MREERLENGGRLLLTLFASEVEAGYLEPSYSFLQLDHFSALVSFFALVRKAFIKFA